ncbi:hypothetical protein OUZ56_031379 [Daphnia magna]|uniref:Uncharacterized protein n=1 Tax=Daphnia magna TaxID=35525 RepID=A0ABQ9ZU31_9CRUS|nr:hypothetical protein OUZ56_031379 [Daphnia magna]
MKQESISKQRCVGHRQRTGEANPDEKGEIDHKDVLSVATALDMLLDLTMNVWELTDKIFRLQHGPINISLGAFRAINLWLIYIQGPWTRKE